MRPIKNVQLGFNCPKTRETLTPCGTDFHCEDCSKKVIDFTNRSEEELNAIIQSSDQQICGIFKKSQMSRDFLKYAAATLLFSATFAACEEPSIDSDPVKSPAVPKDAVPKEVPNHLVGDIPMDIATTGILVDPMIMAKPVGGMKKFYEALKAETIFPEGMKVSGKVFVKITIDKEGEIFDMTILKGLNEHADQEALRALKALNFPFKPGTMDGKPVDSQLVLPIVFKAD